MPALIYLHGFCSGPDSYKGSYLRDKFAQTDVHLHTPDLNGDDFEHLTIRGQLQIVADLVNEMDGEIILMGSSMGAYLATLFAQQMPRVKKLVLIAPAFQFTTRYMERMAAKDLEGWKRRGFIEVYHYAYQQIKKLHFGILEDAQRYDKMNLDRQIPALLIHGVEDETVPYQLSIDYLRANAEAKLLLLNGDHQLKENVADIWHHVGLFVTNNR